MSLRTLAFTSSALLLATVAACSSEGGTDSSTTGGTGATTGGATSGSGGATAAGGTGTTTGGSSNSGGSPGTGGNAPTGFQCPASPGAAPTGALTATHVEAADPTDFDFHLFEGPVWIDGALYYSDFKTSTGFPSQIKKYTPGTDAVIFIPAAGSAETTSGSNGLAVNTQGNLVAATHDRKEISIYDISTKARTTIVSEYNENPFNSPNDLVLGEGDNIYFTDPDFQKSASPGGQDATRVYHWNGSSVSVVDGSFQNPNGITISPDGATLYVAGGGFTGKLRKYPLVDGVPGSGTDIADISEPDGMTVDCLGNIYATEHSNSRVRVFNSSGTEIATIAIGVDGPDSNATNVAFGGPEGKTLFITGTYALWQIDLDVVGHPY